MLDADKVVALEQVNTLFGAVVPQVVAVGLTVVSVMLAL